MERKKSFTVCKQDINRHCRQLAHFEGNQLIWTENHHINSFFLLTSFEVVNIYDLYFSTRALETINKQLNELSCCNNFQACEMAKLIILVDLAIRGPEKTIKIKIFSATLQSLVNEPQNIFISSFFSCNYKQLLK